jgi:hypothetical protein
MPRELEMSMMMALSLTFKQPDMSTMMSLSPTLKQPDMSMMMFANAWAAGYVDSDRATMLGYS